VAQGIFPDPTTYLRASIEFDTYSPKVGQPVKAIFVTWPLGTSCSVIRWEVSPGGVIVGNSNSLINPLEGASVTVVWNVTTTSAYVIAHFNQCFDRPNVLVPILGQI